MPCRDSMEIPPRGSSKRAPELSTEKLYEERAAESKEFQVRLKRLKGSTQSSQSFDASYWQDRSAVAEILVRQTILNRKISIAELAEQKKLGQKESIEEFEKMPDAQRLRELERAQLVDQLLCQKQSERLKKPGFASALHRSWVKLYTSSKLGLDVKKLNAGPRRTSSQSRFREELMKVSEQKHPDPKKDQYWWCPITSTYHYKSDIKAAHLFPWKSGQDTMIAIFGEEAKDELFSPLNGMLLSTAAEEKLENGAIALVPRIDDLKSVDQIRAWNKSNVKEYKVRVMRPADVGMNKLCAFASDLTWNQLDNQPVDFRRDFRPRARYLYYGYCVAIMRLAYNVEKRHDALRDSLGKGYWGTVGPYMKKSMIRGLVEVVGHEFDELMESVIPDDEDEPDLSVLASANAQILRAHVKEDNTEQPVFSSMASDDEDEEEEGEEEEGGEQEEEEGDD